MPHRLDRRAFFTGTAALGAASMIDGPMAMAAPRRPFFERVGLPIGLQIYTLGPDVASDLDRAFVKIAAQGYREIELPNMYGKAPEKIRAAADKAGLAISSLHIVPAPPSAKSVTLDSPPAEIARTLGVLGARRAVVPIAPFPGEFKPLSGETPEQAVGRIFQAAGADHWKRVADRMNRVGGDLKPLSIRLGYHNHNVEFAPIGDTTGWEILVRGTDPALVDFEVDTGWIASAGLDPVAFLARHRGRVTQMHVKDVAAGVTPNFVLATKPAIIGTGTLDWKAILPAAYKAGVRHFYVEQEAPFSTPRLEATARSCDYLSKLVA